MPGKIKNYTEEFKKQIVSLYQNGKSASKIAEEYGIGKSTVAKWVASPSSSYIFSNFP